MTRENKVRLLYENAIHKKLTDLKCLLRKYMNERTKTTDTLIYNLRTDVDLWLFNLEKHIEELKVE